MRHIDHQQLAVMGASILESAQLVLWDAGRALLLADRKGLRPLVGLSSTSAMALRLPTITN